MKKKILYHSDFSLLKTGFARTARLVLTHLHNTGKYDIVHYCCGVMDNNPAFGRLPWKSIGTLPQDPLQQKRLARDPKLAKMTSYGAFNIDEVIKNEKPDVYLAVQDIWGINYAVEKEWFSEISSAIWTTLDSLPILPMAVETAKKTENFWTWSSFAQEALAEIGVTHSKTLHGPLDETQFYKLPEEERTQLRAKFGLNKDAFIVGYVFRNQLRKSVPNLLKGYKKFKEENKEGKFHLLLHTHFGEGWNILDLAAELEIDESEILTTYFCKHCGLYFVARFQGQDLNCPNCLSQSSLVTTSPSNGVSEEQLNEIYNLMDVYCHPFTSGGQEIPIQEAKLCELTTLVTNYSCGTDMCKPEAGSYPLSWHEFREHETQFIKASTDPESICESLTAAYKLSPEEREERGKKAREWTIERYSINKIGKELELFIDESPVVDKKIFEEIKKDRNPEALIDPDLPDLEWLKSLYSEILDMPDLPDDDSGILYWLQEMSEGTTREKVLKYFRGVAHKEVSEETDLSDILDSDDEGRRILFVIPESAGDIYLCTSLFESLKEQYPDYNLYVSCENHFSSILLGNPHVHKVIGYTQEMDDLLLLEGKGTHKGYFEIAFLPHITTQRHMTYQHNGKDKIAFDLELD